MTSFFILFHYLHYSLSFCWFFNFIPSGITLSLPLPHTSLMLLPVTPSIYIMYITLSLPLWLLYPFYPYPSLPLPQWVLQWSYWSVRLSAGCTMTWTRSTSPATCLKCVARRRCCRSEYKKKCYSAAALYCIFKTIILLEIARNNLSQTDLTVLSILRFELISFHCDFLIPFLCLPPYLSDSLPSLSHPYLGITSESCTNKTGWCFYILPQN